MKLSDLKYQLEEAIKTHGDLDVYVLDEDGMNTTDIELLVESDEDGKVDGILIVDMKTSEALKAIEGELDDYFEELDDEKLN